MPKIGPIKRVDLIRFLRKSGFLGPYSGGKHQLMIKGTITVRVPNPHQSDISKGLLLRILNQGGINKSDWEKL
jgi:hypothetical protein